MSQNRQKHGTPFQQTSSNSGSSTTAKQSASSGKKHYVTDVSGSADNSGATLEVIEDEGDSNTVLYQVRIDNDSFNKEFSNPLEVKKGDNVAAKVSGGSSDTKANIEGFTLSAS